MLNTQEMRKLIRFIVAPIVREAEEDDAEQLMQYLNRIADDPVNNTAIRHGLIPATVEGYRDMIREHRQRDNWMMYVADADDRLVGMVRLTGGLLPVDRHDAELHLNIDRDYRGMGLGTALMQQALSWARECSTLRRVHLYALRRNEGAIRLYRRHGFVLEGQLRKAYHLYDEGDIYADAVLMARSIR
jgi:RimJ/RimL family protein N-acetyltransferase